MIPLLLAVTLAAPPSLGEALRGIGAFEQGQDRLDRSLDAPPPPPRTGAKLLIGTGVALIVTGLVGLVVTPHCATREASGRCVHAEGAHPAFPTLAVVGLATTSVGSWWFRKDAPPEPDR